MLKKNVQNLIPKNWEEILKDLGFKLAYNGQDYRSNAFYRNGKNPTSLVIYPSTGTFHDFGNGKTGSIAQLIAWTKGVPIDEVENALGYVQKNPDKDLIKTLDIPKTYSDKGLLKLNRNFQYFGKRGISQQTQEVFEAYFCTQESFYNRILFPIRNFQNQIIGFSGRLINWKEGDKWPKWLHKGPTRFFVYNHIVATPAIKNENIVICCESIGDVMSLYEAGIKNAVVLFGLNISPALIKYFIALNPKKIIIATNNDKIKNKFSGELGAEKIKSKLLNFFSEYKIEIKFPYLNDFNDMLIKEGKESIQKWYKEIYNK